jgi:hypothetical protein
MRTHGGPSLEAAIMEKLRQFNKQSAALELHRTIHDFAALSRFITNVERAENFGFTDGFPVSRI